MDEILIIYYSKGNNTQNIAEYIKDQLERIKPDTVAIHMMKADNFDIKRIVDASGYVFGSPDYFGYVSGYLKVIFDELYLHRERLEDRPAFGFISHGGGGRATSSLDNLLSWTKLNKISPVISVIKSNISDKIKEEIKKSCQYLIKNLKK